MLSLGAVTRNDYQLFAVFYEQQNVQNSPPLRVTDDLPSGGGVDIFWNCTSGKILNVEYDK